MAARKTANMFRAVTSRAMRVAEAQRYGVRRMTQRPKFEPTSMAFPRREVAGRALSTEKVSFTIIDADGNPSKVVATAGQTLLDVAHENDIELEGACGGELACSTCHLVFEQDVFDKLPEITEEEEDMLDLAWGLTDTSRLGCQIHVSKDLEGTTIRVPDESNNLM
ncbi:hypothetical protein ATCC90586_003046 [Pythium insidiosum]|nr:hypothetical protein ATCC90586_003046 [Pythium insidiosum]